MAKEIKIRLRKYLKKKKPKRNRRIDKKKEYNKFKKETNEHTHVKGSGSPKKDLLFPRNDFIMIEDCEEEFYELDRIVSNSNDREEERIFNVNVSINQY